MSKAMKKFLCLLGALVLVLTGVVIGVTRMSPATPATAEVTETAPAVEVAEEPTVAPTMEPTVTVIETATSVMGVNTSTGEILWERAKEQPMAVPTVEPTAVPTAEPTAIPTAEPVAEATEAPEQKSAPMVVETEWAVICYDSSTGEILWEREKKSETKEPSETVEAEEAPDEVVETVEIVENVDLPDTPETPETLELASSEEVSEVAEVAESTEVIEEVTEEEAIAPGKTYVVEGEVNVYATRTSPSSFATIPAGTSVLVVAVDGQFTTIHVPYGETVVEVYVLTADLLGNG